MTIFYSCKNLDGEVDTKSTKVQLKQIFEVPNTVYDILAIINLNYESWSSTVASAVVGHRVVVTQSMLGWHIYS